MRLRPIPALEDNYVWMLDDGSSAVVVDPGSASPVFEVLRTDVLSLEAILLTHHHGDHVGGVPELLDAYPRARVIGPHDGRIAGNPERVAEGATIAIQSPPLRFDVIEIPGHTTSHIAFIGEGVVFCGDTLFSLGCGRMFEGTPSQFRRSLSRLSVLPDSTLVCCGHEYTASNARFALVVDPTNGELSERLEQVLELRKHGQPTVPSSMGQERRINPFLRVSEPVVRAAITRQCGATPTDDIETFASLRAWKDEFRIPVS